MNKALCNSCQQLVKADRLQRDNELFLVKQCPQCGPTETLISSNARRYFAKRALEQEQGLANGCGLNCLNCNHGKTPNLVFIDITNRCNLNCPICINNTPSMGFVFDPPMEYFHAIFDHLNTLRPKPSVQLFGGEPTVRRDLLEMIEYARNLGIQTRVVTNGVRLADEAYCRELVNLRATILLAYDGANPETYRTLRDSEKALGQKQKALENLGRLPEAKVTLMSLVAKGFNDHELPELFELCHRYPSAIRAVYFMPLAHTWDEGVFTEDFSRTTIEDVESIVAESFGEPELEFIPAGFLGQIKNLLRVLRVKPLPFGSAHPNCESLYLLVNNGEAYVPVSHYLKGSVVDVARGLAALDDLLVAKISNGRLRTPMNRLRALCGVASLAKRYMRLGMFIKGSGLGKLYHLLALLGGLIFGKSSAAAFERHSAAQGALQIVVLPFEDKCNIETERMERCPTAFAFFDPEESEVKFVPTCAWPLFKNDVMRGIVDHYSGGGTGIATARK